MPSFGAAASLIHVLALGTSSAPVGPGSARLACQAGGPNSDSSSCELGVVALVADSDVEEVSMIQRLQSTEDARAAQRLTASQCPPIQGDLTLDHFRAGGECGCYDRSSRNQWAVVDSHFHERPFGGEPVPAEEVMQWQQRAGVLFTTIYGIGQRLPVNSNCTYYLDCPGTPINSSMKNDFDVATTYLDMSDDFSANKGPVQTLSMSFPDLNRPSGVPERIQLLDLEYPGLFRWMGELNVVKQALFNNSAGTPVHLDTMKDWAPFMENLRKRGIPMGLHSDIGNDAEPEKYLPLMDEILELYPHNRIVWLHLGGLSKQLTPLPPALLTVPMYADQHAQIIRERLQRHPNLMIDLAWDVLYYCCYEDPSKRAIYAKLIDEFPTRFIPGTDFVAAEGKKEGEYRDQLNKTSFIYKSLTDEAFRNIALGQNYFDLLGTKNYTAPKICASQSK